MVEKLPPEERERALSACRGYVYHDAECPKCGDPAIEPEGVDYDDYRNWTDEQGNAHTIWRCMMCSQPFSVSREERDGRVVATRTTIDEPENDRRTSGPGSRRRR